MMSSTGIEKSSAMQCNEESNQLKEWPMVVELQ